MEDFKIVLVYDKPMYPHSQPAILGFSTREAAEAAIVQLEKSPLRNTMEVGMSSTGTLRRTSIITDIHRLYTLF